MNKHLLRAEKYFGAFLLRFLGLTIKKKYFGEFPTEPVVFMLWHRDQIPLAIMNRDKSIGVLVSQSSDGELIAGPISKLGFIPIRGSSTRGGSKALKGLVSHLKNYPVAITPDGPQGPVYSIKDGMLVTAYLAKRPIVPVAIDVSREWTFNSWDKFRFPKPFCRIRQMFGMKFYIENKEDIPLIKEKIKEEMDRIYDSIRFK